MGCLITVLALLTPRVAIIVIWLFSDLLSAAYETALWPVLGFIFLPYTTLAYMAAVVTGDGSISGLWLVLIVVAVLADLGFFGHGVHTHRHVYRRRPPQQ